MCVDVNVGSEARYKTLGTLNEIKQHSKHQQNNLRRDERETTYSKPGCFITRLKWDISGVIKRT